MPGGRAGSGCSECNCATRDVHARHHRLQVLFGDELRRAGGVRRRSLLALLAPHVIVSSGYVLTHGEHLAVAGEDGCLGGVILDSSINLSRSRVTLA